MQKNVRRNKVKSYDELTFADDYMFCKVMTQNPDLCREVAELITGRKIREIATLRQQAAFKVHSDGKGIRFDVYFEDDQETMYDIEMQTTDKKALSKRARYYHSILDADKVKEANEYDSLSDSYVIFICLKDPFKASLPVYTVRYTCMEDPSVEVDNGNRDIFLNAAAAGKAENDLREFLKYVGGADGKSALTEKIQKAVMNAIDDDDGRRMYMTLLERDKEKIEEGRAEGRAEGRVVGQAEGAARQIVLTVDNLVSNYGVSLEKACEMVRCTAQEYDEAKNLVGREPNQAGSLNS